MPLHQSGEDYLEAILVLKQERGMVRSIDVAQHLGFSKPSVSRAMSILKSDGLVEMDRNGGLELTEVGGKVAEEIYRRHCLLTRWLTQIGVSAETAAADACRMEHVISAETFQRLQEFMDGRENRKKSNHE